MKLTRGSVLAFRRKRMGVAQATLAETLGWAQSTLCKLEKGRMETDKEKLDAAEKALDSLEC